MITTPTRELTVSLDNIERRFVRDGDETAIGRFIDSLLASHTPLPSWEKAAAHIYPLIEGGELEIAESTLHQSLSEQTQLVAVYYFEASELLRFLTRSSLADWQVSDDEVWTAANQNLERLMDEATVSVLSAGDLKLGVIETEGPFKASLIRARCLKAKVEADLGWPVLAVAPDRDFVYLLNEADKDELGRLGATVIKEFQSAEYPISTEVWRLDDDGAEVIGEFPVDQLG